MHWFAQATQARLDELLAEARDKVERMKRVAKGNRKLMGPDRARLRNDRCGLELAALAGCDSSRENCRLLRWEIQTADEHLAKWEVREPAFEQGALL